MTDTLSRRLTVAVMAMVLLVAAALAAQAQDGDDDDPSETPTAESDLDASDDPSENADDDASDEPDDPAGDASEESGSDALDRAMGLEALLTDDAVDSDALYQAFLRFLISAYDSTIVVEDDTLSIQFDLQDL